MDKKFKNFEISDWLNYYASRVKHPILNHWLYEQNTFFETYLTTEDDTKIIIFNKRSMQSYEFNKIHDSFKIQTPLAPIQKNSEEHLIDTEQPESNRILFKLGRIELIRRR